MKGKMKLLLALLMFLCSISVSAQDVIVKKDGSTIVCRVVEVSSSEIIYKRWTDLNGSNYVMNRADASGINYESGKKENFAEMTNLYAPNNQNDGTQQFNDKALLAIDETIHSIKKRANTLRIIGLVGGAAMAAAGIWYMDTTDDWEGFTGISIIGGGALFATGFIIAAQYQIKKSHQLITTIPLYQKDLIFANGSSLAAGVDILKDRMLNQQTFGVGLSYNF